MYLKKSVFNDALDIIKPIHKSGILKLDLLMVYLNKQSKS